MGKDHTGERFNNWIVLKPFQGEGGQKYYCQCSRCGAISVKTIDAIQRNKTGRCKECPPDYHFVVHGDVAEGILGSGEHFLIDTEDVDKVSKYFWGITKDGYIHRTNVHLPWLMLHQFVLDFKPTENLTIDHINHNRLDCRKRNLRIVTLQQNCMNSSLNSNNRTGYKGVYFSNSSRKYESKIGLNRRRIRLWGSADPVECAQAYNIAAASLFGEFTGYHNDVPNPDRRLYETVMQRIKPYRKETEEATRKCGLSFCPESA